MTPERLQELALAFGKLANTEPPEPPPAFAQWLRARTAAWQALQEACREFAREHEAT